MNLEFLVVALVIGKVVDWIFQSQHQAENKTKNFWDLFEHSLCYSIVTTILVAILLSSPLNGDILWIGLLITHMIIDNRMFVRFIMYCKGLTWEQTGSPEYAWLQLGIDQRLHDVVILVIAFII